MVSVYPIYLMESDGMYVVRIPDFEQYTEGNDLADAIDMARDAIGQMGVYYQDIGKKLPKPFSKDNGEEKGETRTLVDIDFEKYRATDDNRLVKKNCNIPYYLERAADKAEINYSKLLAEAIINKLGIAVN